MKKRIFALVAACALLLTGCGQSAGDAKANKDGLRELTVVLDWYPNALHAFLYQAEQQGYFAEEGLTVKLQSPAGTNDALSMVAAGKADIGLYYQQDVIQARAEQNIPVKSVGAVVQAPLNIVLSLAEKNIKSPADLVGKTVGYAGTELSEALVRSMAVQSGADAADVKLVDVGFDLMASMTTGNVDATIGCLVNHEVPQMEEEGFSVNYFFPSDFGVPQYYEGVFVANDRMVAEDPAVIAAFLSGCKKGFDDFKNDPYTVLETLLSNQDAENFPLSESVERKSCDMLLPLMETPDAPFLSQTAQRWQENIDWMYGESLIGKKPAVSDLMAQIEF